jgi:hypothetical protein
MMETRLSKLAAELVRGSRAPRVLDYAPPEPPRRRAFAARVVNEIEYWGGPRYLGFLALGAAMVLVGWFAGIGLLGLWLESAGVLVIVLTRAWRAWRDMDL